MQRLPKNLVASFKAAWREAYDTDVSDDDAERYGWELLETIGLLLRIRARSIRKESAHRKNDISAS